MGKVEIMPPGDPITLKFSAGAVFGVFKVQRREYQVWELEPGSGWFAHDSAGSQKEAREILADLCETRARVVAEDALGFFADYKKSEEI